MEMLTLIVSPLLQTVYEKLFIAISDVQTRSDFRKEIVKLQSTIPTIQALIEDAEERQEKDKKVKIWVAKLKDVAYDADDLLDQIGTLNLQRRIIQLRHKNEYWSQNLGTRRPSVSLQLTRRRFKKVFRMTSFNLESFSRYRKMFRYLKNIRERFDDIVSEMHNFRFREVAFFNRSDTMEKRQTGPYVDESEVWGRKEDLEKIVSLLVSSNNTSVSMIPIVGIGGIGKTTLTQLAFNDQRVTTHFDLKIWVSTYDNFSAGKLMNEILEYATKHKCESQQIGLLQSQLQEVLRKKKYLLVLDDVWNDDQDEWEKVRNLLRGGADGSKIIVTTRSEKVASIMSSGTSPPHVLEALSNDDCWNLFRQRAFAEGEEDRFKSLLPIGRQIVDKCKGVPFAAKVLGSLMRFKREENEWLHVQKSELWNLDGGQNRILSVLRLSYNHLPSHLKQCFAYCSLFPKSYVINKEKLIQQWIAQGLIQVPGDQHYNTLYVESIIQPPPNEHSYTLEDAGNEYFNDLLGMSFFQAVSKYDNGSIEEFKMHDLIHDLAKSVAGNEFLTIGHDNMQGESHHTPAGYHGFAKTRHALVVCNFRCYSIPQALYKAKKLHSLDLLSSGDTSENALPQKISTFVHLRMLNLSGCNIGRLHKSIGELIFLRYFDLSNNPVEKLPMTICDLCNLQTLNLASCNWLMELPKNMEMLINLRHLNIKDCARLASTPGNIGKLRKLQTLPIFIVGLTPKEDIQQLEKLTGLRGELKIKHLENSSLTSYKTYPIRSMQLSLLELSWGDTDDKSDHNRSGSNVPRLGVRYSMTVINCLQPNPLLSRLVLNGYPGAVFPIWMDLVTIGNLTHLELINCKKSRFLPTIGQLPLLQVLILQGMDAVVNIGSYFYGEGSRPFPSLKELILRDFPVLKTWESMISAEAFPCLNKLTIVRCPFLRNIPWFPSLQHLELQNCNEVMIRSASELRSLSTVIIDCFPNLSFLPEVFVENSAFLISLTVTSCPKLLSMPANFGNLAALELLKIGWCDQLETLPNGLRNLISLQNMEIVECPSLISLPEESLEGLSSLRSFSIENCNSLVHLPAGMKHLTALEHLTIIYCSNLASLPDGLQHLSALRSLTVISCPDLQSLPEGLQHVQTLQNLEIRSCAKLMELPEWVEHLVSLRSLAISDCQNIKSLPAALRKLGALQHLSIRDCMDLERRCMKGNGEDWQKISHIPYVYVGSPV